MKYFYIAITIQENEKYYSYVIKVNSQENILPKLEIKNIVTATITATKKEAENLVNLWNIIAKGNNQYLFNETF
jgi:hypothetical protein